MSITDETLFILVVCAAMPCLVETLERGLPAFHCPQTRGVREVFAKILQAMDRKHLRAEVCIKYPCFIRTNYSYLNQYSTQAGCAETDILAKSQENSGKSWKQIFNSMKQTSAIISFKMAAIIRHAGRVTSSSATIPELLDSLEPLHLIDLTWSDWSWFLAAWCIHMHPCWKTLKHTLLGLKDPLHWDQPKVLQRGRQTLLCLRGKEMNWTCKQQNLWIHVSSSWIFNARINTRSIWNRKSFCLLRKILLLPALKLHFPSGTDQIWGVRMEIHRFQPWKTRARMWPRKIMNGKMISSIGIHSSCIDMSKTLDNTAHILRLSVLFSSPRFQLLCVLLFLSGASL